MTYTAIGLEAVLSFTSLSATIEVITGSSSSLLDSLDSSTIILLFSLPIIFIGISIIFLFIGRTRISAVIHVIGLFFLFTYFANFYLIGPFDGEIRNGILLNVAFGAGYYLIAKKNHFDHMKKVNENKIEQDFIDSGGNLQLSLQEFINKVLKLEISVLGILVND